MVDWWGTSPQKSDNPLWNACPTNNQLSRHEPIWAWFESSHDQPLSAINGEIIHSSELSSCCCCCLLFVVCCCLLFVVCCLLFVVCCLLLVVCCLLFVVCCLLFVVCCCCWCWCCCCCWWWWWSWWWFTHLCWQVVLIVDSYWVYLQKMYIKEAIASPSKEACLFSATVCCTNTRQYKKRPNIWSVLSYPHISYIYIP